MKNKKKLLVLAIILVGVAIFSTSRKTQDQTKISVIKIGYILPLSGNQANSGEVAKKAALMALEDINKKDNKYSYEFIIEDDGFAVKKSAMVVNKLINVDKVQAIASFGSGTGNVAAPIADRSGIIHFGMASDGNIAKGDNNFMHWTTPKAEAKKLVEKYQEQGVKKLAIVSVNHSGPNAILDDVMSNLKGSDIEVTSINKTNIGDRDFRMIIAQIKNQNPDMFYVEMFSPEQDIFVKQLREAGINTPVTDIELFAMSEQLEIFEGQWFVDAAMGEKGFLDRFKDDSGLSSSFSAPYAYDVAIILREAFENTGDGVSIPSTDSISEYINTLKDYKGVTGDIAVDSEGIFQSEASVRVIKNGKIELLE